MKEKHLVVSDHSWCDWNYTFSIISILIFNWM